MKILQNCIHMSHLLVSTNTLLGHDPYLTITPQAVEYGDPESRYARFLVEKMTNGLFVSPFYFWDELNVTGVNLSGDSSKTSENVQPTGGASSGAVDVRAFGATWIMSISLPVLFFII